MFDPNFCNESNIPTCFGILMSELDLIDISAIPYEEGSKHVLIYMCNVAWSLLVNRKRQAVRINEQNEIILDLKSKLHSSEESNKKNILIIKNEKKQSMLLADSLERLRSEKDALTSEIREAKKEIKFHQSMLSKQQLQFEHDIRRKNCQIEELQTRLFKLLGSEHKKIAGKCEEKVTKDISVVAATELTNKCLSNLQNNIQLLLAENVNLRNCLLKTYVHYVNIKNNTDGELDYESQGKLLKLPYQDLINEIERYIINCISAGKGEKT